MERTSSVDQSEWERAKRVTVYNSPRRARYPSIMRAGGGALLVLFMRQTAEQEAAARGDLVLARSTDEGQTWSDGTVVFQSREGEPRAVGTMTILKSGQIIAPFAEFGEAQMTSRFRLLSSEDSGKNWQVNDPTENVPLIWWAPCGRGIEISDDALVMPVYGAASQTDLKATIHDCGCCVPVTAENPGASFRGSRRGVAAWLVPRRSVVSVSRARRFSRCPMDGGWRWRSLTTKGEVSTTC